MKNNDSCELDALLDKWSQSVDLKKMQNEKLINSLMQKFDNKHQYENYIKIQKLLGQNRFYKLLCIAALFFLAFASIVMIANHKNRSEVNKFNEINLVEDFSNINNLKKNLDDIFVGQNYNFALIDNKLELSLENSTIKANSGSKFLISFNIIKRNNTTGKQEIRQCSFVMQQNTNFNFIKDEKFSLWALEVNSFYLALDTNFSINFDSGKFDLNDTFLLKYNEPQIVAKIEQQDERITIIQMVRKI